MCFFVGNDFLPHLPSLEIREGAIDRLVKLYKEMVYKTKGLVLFFVLRSMQALSYSWLTEDGDVNIDRVKIIMKELGQVEDEIFRTRQVHIKFEWTSDE
jgi:5'-3' exoribonuclease 2